MTLDLGHAKKGNRWRQGEKRGKKNGGRREERGVEEWRGRWEEREKQRKISKEKEVKKKKEVEGIASARRDEEGSRIQKETRMKRTQGGSRRDRRNGGT